MDILVTGRHCQINDEFRERVTDKLAAVERLKDRVIRIEVQVTAAKKSSAGSTQVEITLRSKGPVVRAEAVADDKNAAFDLALDRLKAQLRRASDRRKAHRGLRPHIVELPPLAQPKPAPAPEIHTVAGIEVQGDGPLVVREKEFDTTPLTLAQALDEMELVGHDFFLYVDADTGKPSVVYLRKAYDYGVIHLNLN
ncbi:MAG: ribosome-associated translation inhibitor RaiA [Propionibacteriaceae bacterium]|jgi:ribosomal subunit interface protein|nr:ribosome-associated translation inhibitor RaiA [Propionibacteriaceae bacterium]